MPPLQSVEDLASYPEFLERVQSSSQIEDDNA